MSDESCKETALEHLRLAMIELYCIKSNRFDKQIRALQEMIEDMEAMR